MKGFAFSLTVLSGLILTGCAQKERRAEASDLYAGCGTKSIPEDDMVKIPGGRFIKGQDAYYPEERPVLELHVDGFSLLSHEVTNAEFRAFVEATGYVTDAERVDPASGALSGSAVFRTYELKRASDAVWQLVEGASWRSPAGPGSTPEVRGDLPVVHVSLNDAKAYASWAGGRLPTEVEWEYAARMGLRDPEDAVSGAYDDKGTPVANTWQGVFPVVNTVDDGFSGASPVGCFGPDRAGLYDMIGNVWEWTDTPYSEDSYTIKGGSYLCAENFCRRFRPPARQPHEVGFSTSHIGFRIVMDEPATPETQPSL